MADNHKRYMEAFFAKFEGYFDDSEGLDEAVDAVAEKARADITAQLQAEYWNTIDLQRAIWLKHGRGDAARAIQASTLADWPWEHDIDLIKRAAARIAEGRR